ncbi:hypothetical protein JN09_001176 [Acholeplasma morum]|uniref:hypothetical protein n=1 Tax=Paracholeplasma morum TaxID=264637 RepID=UPI00195B2412|nr:hypothetical protein [Paracholeplasma morum]MBM7453843.1 hypothetical protein [Paracholeplasma morum]
MRIVKMEYENVVIDGDFVELHDITTELLDQIVKQAMQDEALFDINPSNISPLAEFFRMVENGSRPNSPFRQHYLELSSK